MATCFLFISVRSVMAGLKIEYPFAYSAERQIQLHVVCVCNARVCANHRFYTGVCIGVRTSLMQRGVFALRAPCALLL